MKWILGLCLLLAVPTASIGQSSQNKFGEELNEGLKPASRKSVRKGRSSFLTIGAGLNRSWFRDYATAPLIYNGTPIRFSLGHSRQDFVREVELRLDYSRGRYLAIVNDNGAASSVNSLFLTYERLYGIDIENAPKWNLKAGGVAQLTGNVRENGSLLNNGFGMEFMANLSGAGKVTRDLSRKELKEKKFLFIRYKLKPRQRTLSYQLNLGLVNSTFRNGFIYNNQSGVINEDNLTAGYEYKVLSGFRIGSELNYTIFTQRGNAVQFSYLWDAYQTGGQYDRFQMGNHFLRFSLLFRTN